MGKRNLSRRRRRRTDEKLYRIDVGLHCKGEKVGEGRSVTQLRLTPIDLKKANAFVAQHHRHHKPVVGCKFCIAVASDNGICGVAIVGRPVARALDDGFTLEVNRVCTDGTKNACSMLYGACRRAAFALGYAKLVTYTLAEESGASLRGAGYRLIGQRGGRSWSCPSRPRADNHPLQVKLRWDVNNHCSHATLPGIEDLLSGRRTNL